MAEQLSAAGVPVFLADVKGDLSGLGVAGEANDRVTTRAQRHRLHLEARRVPVEFLSLTGKRGAQLRATVSSFGPLLLAKVLGLNETQTSVLALVFKYCDDRDLLLLDFADLRAVLQHLTGEGAAELKDYGGMSKARVGVLLREMVELEAQGALAFFGEPEFDLERPAAGRARRPRAGQRARARRRAGQAGALLDLHDVDAGAALRDAPRGRRPRPAEAVFFFDEAHLLFDGASKAFLEQVEQVVRLVRSKGVGVFFVTQSPKDVPPDVLGQLGHRVQHALRAFTPDDEKALKAAARTFPKTDFYDVEETLTTLGIGEALVTVLGAERRADAAVRDPPGAAGVAHGAAHRRRARAPARDARR